MLSGIVACLKRKMDSGGYLYLNSAIEVHLQLEEGPLRVQNLLLTHGNFPEISQLRKAMFYHRLHPEMLSSRANGSLICSIKIERSYMTL